MAVMSVSIPDELKDKMGRFDEINWSAVARRAFEEKVRQAEIIRTIVSKSRLTQKDADEIARKIDSEVSKKFRGIE